jgi:hypothetical protein
MKLATLRIEDQDDPHGPTRVAVLIGCDLRPNLKTGDWDASNGEGLKASAFSANAAALICFAKHLHVERELVNTHLGVVMNEPRVVDINDIRVAAEVALRAEHAPMVGERAPTVDSHDRFEVLERCELCETVLEFRLRADPPQRMIFLPHRDDPKFLPRCHEGPDQAPAAPRARRADRARADGRREGRHRGPLSRTAARRDRGVSDGQDHRGAGGAGRDGAAMRAATARVHWVGKRQPKRPWLAQIVDGNTTETLSGEHSTEELALTAARKEIARRNPK